MEMNKDEIIKLINDITTGHIESAMVNIFNEVSKLDTNTTDRILDNIIEMVKSVTNAIVDKMDRVQVDGIINSEFIKSVLYTHNLTSEKLYNNYREEFLRLNPSLNIYTNAVTESTIIPTSDGDKACNDLKVGDKIFNAYGEISTISRLSEQCDHQKEYRPYVLTSYPPQRPWECKKCGAIGVDKSSGGV